MPVLPLQRHALAGGPDEMFAGRGWRMSRPAVVVSVLAHLAVLIAAGRWYQAAPPPTEITFEWITALAAPTEPALPLTPDVVESPAPVVEPELPPRAIAPRAVRPPALTPPQPEPAVEAPEEPAGPSRFDLDAARREAAAAVVGQHAGDGRVREALIEDAPPPWPLTAAPKKPSIFDHQPSPPRGLLRPGQQRSVIGQRLSLWCAKNIGGFRLGLGFFSIPACVSQGIQPPSGIMADSIPEYMKLKPECEETEALATTLGEGSPLPTAKCRLVPKDPGE